MYIGISVLSSIPCSAKGMYVGEITEDNKALIQCLASINKALGSIFSVEGIKIIMVF